MHAPSNQRDFGFIRCFLALFLLPRFSLRVGFSRQNRVRYVLVQRDEVTIKLKYVFFTVAMGCRYVGILRLKFRRILSGQKLEVSPLVLVVPFVFSGRILQRIEKFWWIDHGVSALQVTNAGSYEYSREWMTSELHKQKWCWKINNFNFRQKNMSVAQPRSSGWSKIAEKF